MCVYKRRNRKYIEYIQMVNMTVNVTTVFIVYLWVKKSTQLYSLLMNCHITFNMTW